VYSLSITSVISSGFLTSIPDAFGLIYIFGLTHLLQELDSWFLSGVVWSDSCPAA